MKRFMETLVSAVFCAGLMNYSHAITTQAGGETITWEMQGIPVENMIIPNNPCGYNQESNYYVCEYGFSDAPYAAPIYFNGSITPVGSVSYPNLGLYYSGATPYPFNVIRNIQVIGKKPITNQALFYMPASAREFHIMYSSNGMGTGDVNIQINVKNINYDPQLASQYGGQEINADTEYCDEDGQPGKPRIWKYNNRKGAGPGKCSKRNMGLPSYSVNTSSLSLVVKDTDLEYQSAGPRFQATHTYNSNAPLPVPGFPLSNMFGSGWSFSYEEFVTETCEGAGIQLGDGSTYFFGIGPSHLCGDNRSQPPISLVAPDGVSDSLTFKHDPVGQINYWEYFDRKNKLYKRYEYSAGTYRLFSVSDTNDNRITIARNPDGSISSVTDAVGRKTSFVYDASLRCVRMTGPDGNIARYEYDGNNNLVKSWDMMGYLTTFTYESGHYLTALNMDGKVTRFSYTGSTHPKKIYSTTNAMGHTHLYERSNTYETSVKDAVGNVSIYTSNNAGKTVQTFDAYNVSAGEKKYVGNRLSAYTSPSGWKKSLVYDGAGNIANYTKAPEYGEGSTTNFKYDSNNNVTSISDPENPGIAWRSEYDSSSNKVKQITPAGSVTDFVYGDKGLVNQKVEPNGGITSYSRDSNGNIREVTTPESRKWIREFNVLGDKTSETDPLGNKYTFLYDKNRRLTKIINPDGTSRTYSYDCCSLIQIENENGGKTNFQYNNLLQLTSISDPMGNVTRFFYNANDSLVKITRADGTIVEYEVDSLNRPVLARDSSGALQRTTYNGDWEIASFMDERGSASNYTYTNGRLDHILDAQGNALSYTWDKSGRLKYWVNARFEITGFNYTPDGMASKKYNYLTSQVLASYDYNSVNNLIQMTDAWGLQQFTYDKSGLNTGITYPGGKQVAFKYNNGGLIEEITYPNLSVRYEYNSRGHASKVIFGDKSISLTYDPVGNMTGESRSNGVSSIYSYDLNNQINYIKHFRGITALAEYSITRDSMGRASRESVFQPLALSPISVLWSGSYNTLNQVSLFASDKYEYDPDGNLIKVSGNRNLIASYDNDNRLAAFTKAGVTTSFTYNGLGQRVKIENTSGKLLNHFDLSNRLLFQTDESGNVVTSFIYAENRLVAMHAGGAYYFYHFDKMGNTIAITDSGGNIANAYAYQPYGEYTKSGSLRNPFTYVGAFGVYDDGDGFYHMLTRSYDAITGRFLQKDSIGITGGSNLYRYANGNPSLYIDPTGRLAPIFYLIGSALTSSTAGYIYAGITSALFVKTYYDWGSSCQRVQERTHQNNRSWSLYNSNIMDAANGVSGDPWALRENVATQYQTNVADGIEEGGYLAVKSIQLGTGLPTTSLGGTVSAVSQEVIEYQITQD